MVRAALAVVLVVFGHGTAAADAKVEQTAKFFERENNACRKNLRGVTVIVERGKPVAASDGELAADIAELEKAQATVQAQCDEIAAMITFLRSDPSATYKQIEKDIAEREKKIRAGRATSKQALADAQPLISRSVPRINKLIAQADAAARLSTREQKAALAKEQKAAAEKAAAEKAAADKAAAEKVAAQTAKPPVETKPLSKFPSGRAVELPAPAEAWTLSGAADTDIADYAFAGAKATVIVRARAGSPSCEQIKSSANLLAGRTALVVTEVSTELKALKPAWVLAWNQDDRQVRAVCVSTRVGAVVGRVEVGIAGNAPVDTMLVKMIGARAAKR